MEVYQIQRRGRELNMSILIPKESKTSNSTHSINHQFQFFLKTQDKSLCIKIQFHPCFASKLLVLECQIQFFLLFNFNLIRLPQGLQRRGPKPLSKLQLRLITLGMIQVTSKINMIQVVATTKKNLGFDVRILIHPGFL